MNRALALLALGLFAAGCHPDFFGCQHNSNLYMNSVAWSGEGGVTVSLTQDGDPDHLCNGYRSFDADGRSTDHATAAVSCAAKVADCTEPQMSFQPTIVKYPLADGSLVTMTLGDDWKYTVERHDAAGALVYSVPLHLGARIPLPVVSDLRGDFFYAALQSADPVQWISKIDIRSGEVVWSTPVVDSNGVR